MLRQEQDCPCKSLTLCMHDPLWCVLAIMRRHHADTLMPHPPNRKSDLVRVHCCHSDIILQLCQQAVLQLLLSLAAAPLLMRQHAAYQGHLCIEISREL